MDFTLIKVKEDDILFLLDLRINTMSEHFEKANVSLSTNDHLELVKENFECMYFVLCDDKKIGMLKYEETGCVCKIHQLQIIPRHQGKGYGRDILNFTKALFVDNNRTGCKFITVDAYRESLDFYVKNGFKYLSSRDKKSDTRLMYYNLGSLNDY